MGTNGGKWEQMGTRRGRRCPQRVPVSPAESPTPGGGIWDGEQGGIWGVLCPPQWFHEGLLCPPPPQLGFGDVVLKGAGCPHVSPPPPPPVSPVGPPFPQGVWGQVPAQLLWLWGSLIWGGGGGCPHPHCGAVPCPHAAPCPSAPLWACPLSPVPPLSPHFGAIFVPTLPPLLSAPLWGCPLSPLSPLSPFRTPPPFLPPYGDTLLSPSCPPPSPGRVQVSRAWSRGGRFWWGSWGLCGVPAPAAGPGVRGSPIRPGVC